MKKYPVWLTLGISVLLLVFFLHPASALVAPKPYNQIQFPPLKEVQIPTYERYQLPNGMVVYLMEDHQLPLISGSLLVRTGTRLEPLKKTGLGDIMGTVLRTGGTEKYSPSELNQILEQKAASIESNIDTSVGTVSFTALSEDTKTILNLVSEVLQSPRFDAQQIELAKRQWQGSISRRNDNPQNIASREFNKLIYGQDSPYATTVEYQTLDNIHKEDIEEFYRSYFRPDGMILGIIGDFNSREVKGILTQAFGNWQNPTIPPDLTIPTATQKHQGGVFNVNQPQLTQSNIFVGHLGGELKDADYPALSLLNEVMSGFGGRLFNELRSRQGLAYSVYGLWRANFDYPGLYIAGGQTRSDTTVPFIQAIMAEIQRVRTTPVTTAELTAAKESVLNSFVFNFEQPYQTLSRLMRYEYYKYPSDFIFQYQKAISKVTLQDIQTVANKSLQPEKMVTLVVGNTSAIKPPLDSLGKTVENIDVSIPVP